MGKPVFLKVIFLRLLGFDLRRYDTCQFGLLNNKKNKKYDFSQITFFRTPGDQHSVS